MVIKKNKTFHLLTEHIPFDGLNEEIIQTTLDGTCDIDYYVFEFPKYSSCFITNRFDFEVIHTKKDIWMIRVWQYMKYLYSEHDEPFMTKAIIDTSHNLRMIQKPSGPLTFNTWVQLIDAQYTNYQKKRNKTIVPVFRTKNIAEEAVNLFKEKMKENVKNAICELYEQSQKDAKTNMDNIYDSIDQYDIHVKRLRDSLVEMETKEAKPV